jgi:excisionase family DNA binding protein
MSLQNADTGQFLTVAEVAEMLKLNQQTVRNWIDQGSLPALRVGRRVRILRSDLEHMLEEAYTAGGGAIGREPQRPTAEDFWGGEPVGVAEPRVDDSQLAAGRTNEPADTRHQIDQERDAER